MYTEKQLEIINYTIENGKKIDIQNYIKIS